MANRSSDGHPSDDLPDLDVISPVEHHDFVQRPAAAVSRPRRNNSPPVSSDSRPSTPLREYFTTATSPNDSPILLPERRADPFLFRTHINIPHINFPSLFFFKRKHKSPNTTMQRDLEARSSTSAAQTEDPIVPLERVTSAASNASFTMRDGNHMRFFTRVWSDDTVEPSSSRNPHPLQTHDEEHVTVETEITQHAR